MKNTHSKLKEEKDNKKKKKETGFTLVELIVVITILAILATIAFISFTGYSQNSRDSKRIADINSIQKSLELYITEKGTYPIPDNNASITYSGAIAWIEGTVGDGVMINMENINKKPLDPLTENEYTYSVTSSKTEYQIGAITEGGTIGYKLPINQTHAATEKKATAMVRGTYNERFLRVQSGTLNWILAIPSIIATDITQTNVQTILDNNKLVYNNYQNIPHSYNNAGYTMTGGFNYTNSNPLIYSGSLKSLTESNTDKLDFITKLKAAYEGTILHGETNYQDIVNAEPGTNSTGAIYLVNRFINTNVGGIKVSNIILPTTGIVTEELEILVNGNCTGLPVNAVYYNGTTSYTLVNATGGTTLDAIIAGHNASPIINTCAFKCDTNYGWNGSACIASCPSGVNCTAVSGLRVRTANEGSAEWSNAISLCDNLTYGGFSDWYLPNKTQLNQLYNARSSIGGFTSSRWWSSTGYDSSRAWRQYFGDGTQNYDTKYQGLWIRCVRPAN